MPTIDRSKPSRPGANRASENSSKTTPPKRSRDEDDDEDFTDVRKKTSPLKPTPKPEVAKKSRRDEDDDTPAPRAKKSTGSGWGAVAAKKKEGDASKAQQELNANKLREVKIKDGETAVIQFLDDEPYCMDGHNVKDARGYWGFQPCQLAVQKHCLMCSDNIRLGWKAAFKVLDYRGAWDKDKKDFKHDGTPVEKIWMVSATVAQQINSQVERRGKPLTQLMFEVTRTGSGAKDTSYNFEPAVDEDDVRMKPIKHRSKHEIADQLEPLDDDALESMGFEGGD